MKKHLLKLITLGLAVFLIVGCTSSKKEPVEVVNISTTKADMTKYQLTENEHEYYSLSFDELEKILDTKGSAVIYLGTPGCPFCLEAVPLLNELLKEENTFAYALTLATDEEITTFQTDIFADFLSEDERVNGLQIPQVFVIKDGKIISNHLGTVSTHNAHERVMNDDEKAELTAIYTKMIESIK